MNSLPTREETASVLRRLAAKSLSSEDASSWAVSILQNKDVSVTDWAVWEALKNIGGADLRNPDGTYLYKIDDFSSWLADLLEAENS
jgi:hypothetical protein